MKKISDRQRGRLKLYAEAKRQYMAENKYCEVCIDQTGQDFRPFLHTVANTVHHRRGRAGSLIWDRRFFLSVCNGCHDRIHRNPAWAREHGYLQSWHNTKDT